MFPPAKNFFLGRAEKVREAGLRLARAHNAAAAELKKLQPKARVGVAHNVTDLLPAKSGDEVATLAWERFMHFDFLDETQAALDFIGVNYYTRVFVSAFPMGPFGALPGHAEIEKGLTWPVFKMLGGRREPGPRTAMGWEVVPEGLERVLIKLWQRYKVPMMVTENGLAPAGDLSRERFLRGHLKAVHDAMSGGAKIEGYLHWSLLDNYEWGSYKPRFGLFDRQRRPAEGAAFFAEVSKNNGF